MQGPCFILEVTSKTTRKEDETLKKSRYAQLGVEEYFLFDPRSEYLHPRFQGLRLTGGVYQPLPLDPDGSLTSRTIGISFRPQGNSLRMTDVKTGRLLLSYTEWKAAAQAAEERAEAESAARRAAEERVTQAEERATQAEERAGEEAAARRAAEERVRALAEELERLRHRP
jgi:hypothetical protein